MALSLILAFAVSASAGQSKSRRSTKKKSTNVKPTTTVKQTPKTPGAPAPSVVKPEESQEVERITVEELKEKIAKNQPVFVIDSRSQSTYDATETKIKGAVRIPSGDIEARLKEIPPDKEIVIYCT